jgi:hypothetical protein
LKEVLEDLVSKGVCHVIWEKGIKIEDDLVKGMENLAKYKAF